MKSLSLSKPHLIIMVGLPGSGKSFFADKFAETFGAPYASYDKITSLVSGDMKTINQLLHYQLDELIKTQKTIILEGSADTRTERIELTRKARAAGYDTLLIWVQTDTTTAKARVTKEAKTTLRISPEEYDHRTKRFTPPNRLENPIVISGKHTYATQAKVVLKKLSAPRAEISHHTAAPLREETPRRRNITIR